MIVRRLRTGQTTCSSDSEDAVTGSSLYSFSVLNVGNSHGASFPRTQRYTWPERYRSLLIWRI